MIAGLAPISAYRTLDLPAVGSLTALAMGPLNDPRIEAEVRAALRATGTGVRLFDPVENREEQVLGRATSRSRDDRGLRSGGLVVRLRYGSRSRGRGRGSSRSGGPERPLRGAWFVRGGRRRSRSAFLDDWSGDPRQVLRCAREGRAAVESRLRAPDECTITVEAQERGWVIISPARRSAVERPMDQPGTALDLDDKLRPAFRKSERAGGLAVRRYPRPRPLDLTAQLRSAETRARAGDVG